MSKPIKKITPLYTKWAKKYQAVDENIAYLIFRVLVALLFFLHGSEKLFGFPASLHSPGGPEPFLSLLWFAGMIEFVGGAAVILGIFTRIAAFFSTVEMVFAYFMVHAPRGISPSENGGELAVLYFLSFLLIATLGAGKWSLDRKLWKE